MSTHPDWSTGHREQKADSAFAARGKVRSPAVARYDQAMVSPQWLVRPPSDHALALAGWPLFAAAQPGLVVAPARETVVVVSRSRSPEREVFFDRCRQDDVPVVLRPSGGGAVVLAVGVLTASIVTRPQGAGHGADREFSRFCRRVCEALERCGVSGIQMRGVSDLCLGDRKIAGTALRLWQGLVLFQVSVLVTMDLSLIDRYLPMPSREPDYRQGRGHREFVTSLYEQGFTVSESILVEAIGASFEKELPL